ncbi:RNA polymerase sigma factor [Ornithinibacillus halophilus]|uniref:RNA polymerase, sigma subunit, SigY n=1 Tax=Ornithinibacillus halophilus TaxID=930117 RepID=A0A1M5NRW7_9BACI|nr:RNA polymerase sigma factor [Ornithinibacillus halophilus]SHG92291.1 RNA polymerase, sigma subunit, SigY [Ornithinibacillus halophilus]
MHHLIDSAKAGDIDAYGQLIDQFSGTVERFAFQIGVSYDDVPDVSQEVFLRIYRFLHQFDGESSFSTWLYKITLNVARDYGRKQSSIKSKTELLKRQQNIDASVVEPIEMQLLRDEEDRYLYQCIQELKDKYRIPIVLHYFQDLTYQEISKVIGAKESTVKVRVLRGRNQLADKINNSLVKGGINHG